MMKFPVKLTGLFVAFGLALGLGFAYAEEEAQEEEGVDAAAASAKEGKEIFMAYKCNKCHSIATAQIERTTKSEKIKGPDLGGIVGEAERDWVLKFVKKEAETKEGKKHKNAFKGTEEQLNTVVDWLREQKKAE